MKRSINLTSFGALLLALLVACAPEVPELIATATLTPTLADQVADALPTPVILEPSPSSSAAGSAFQTGDTVRLGDLEVTVHEALTSQGEDFFEPDQGKVFVYVDVAFRNTGAASKNLSSLLQMELQDVQGFTYGIDLSAVATSERPAPEGEIGPGDLLRGYTGYQVPIGTTGLRWKFTGDPLTRGQEVFSLGELQIQ